MKKYTVALTLAALMAAAAQPALACGGSSSKAYRAASSAKSVNKAAAAKKAEPRTGPAALDTTEGLQTTAAAGTIGPASAEL
jgi:hypothetical protein